MNVVWVVDATAKSIHHLTFAISPYWGDSSTIAPIGILDAEQRRGIWNVSSAVWFFMSVHSAQVTRFFYMNKLPVFLFCVLVFLPQLQPPVVLADDGPAIPTDRLGDPQRAGFRGQIDAVEWTLPPTDMAALAAGTDIDLVAMGRWSQHFLAHNTDPDNDYACFFGLGGRRSCPPFEMGNLYADGDTDVRMDLAYMHMAEMCGVGPTADAAAGVRRRILSYLGKDNLALVPGAFYCGMVPPDEMYVSPWTTGKILESLAVTFARTGEEAAKQRAREVFVSLRGLASWDSDRAWYVGGCAPLRDGKWVPQLPTSFPGNQTWPVFRYWQLTGDPEAFHFATALARGTVAGLQADLGIRRVRPDGSFSDHTHVTMHEVRGVAVVGAATQDPRLLEWARRVYEYVRSRGTDYGWFPERMILQDDKPWDGYHERVHIGETCVTADMVNIAASLAQGGYPEYWDHVERYVRNYIRGAQFIMTPKIEAHWRAKWQGKPENDVEAALAALRLTQGSCGALFPANGGPGRWESCGCCAPSGMRAIYKAWKNVVVEDARGVWINMSLNRESPAVTVRSFLPAVGRLSATPHQPGNFHLRPPSWAPRGMVQAFRNGEPSTPVWQGDYVLFAKAAPGEELSVAYPLPEFVQKLGVGGKLEDQRPYQVRWRGNTCLSVEPRAAEFPFFEDVLPVLPEPPKE